MRDRYTTDTKYERVGINAPFIGFKPSFFLEIVNNKY
jgi:hypothetical protein